MALTLNPADLPTAQFTAGSLLKSHPGAKLADVRAELDRLVETGALTVKTASSGARNYKVAKSSGGRKAAAKRTEAKPAVETPTVKASNDRAERVRLAREESKALKAWQRDPKGDRPATPNLDAVNAKAPTKRSSKSTSGSSSPRGTTVQFVVDGRPMPGSQNKLSSVAWYHTKGIGGEDVARIDVKALRDLFAKAGVDDPSNTVGVNVTLPNGKVVTTTKL